MTDGLGVQGLDALAVDEAQAVLLAVCSSPRWAAEVAARRPFATAADALRAADEVLAALPEDEVDAALSGHPRIGERTTGAGAQHSEREQAGLAGMAASTSERLAAGNRAYEQRFGHVYLVCATGRTGPELLAVLEQRLTHTPEQERRVLREELRRINRIRLERLLGA